MRCDWLPPTAQVSAIHRRFYSSKPGVVSYKETASATSWKEVTLLKDKITLDMIKNPELHDLKPLSQFVVQPATLTAERQEQLTKINASYIHNEEDTRVFLLPPQEVVISSRQERARIVRTILPEAMPTRSHSHDELLASLDESSECSFEL